MKLLPIAQKLAEVIDTNIVFDDTRCLHNLDRFSDCRDCFSICPVGAIKAGKPPALDIDSCQYCRACLTACQMGAFTYTGIDAAQALIDCASLMRVKRFELVCQLNPNVDRGQTEVEAAIRIRGCLAGLGAGVYLTLVSQGAEVVMARTDSCAGCPWQNLLPRVEAQIEQAVNLLKLWGRDTSLVRISSTAGDERTAPPIWKAESPPLTRRSLSQLAAWETGDHKDQDLSTGRFRERIRILRAMNQLSPIEVNAQAVTSKAVLAGLDFALISVSAACTACGTCAKICPTSALVFSQSETTFELSFTSQLCIGCDFCTHVCAPQAITLNHEPSYEQIFCLATDQIVQQGDLSHCPKCKAPFTTKTGSKLCPPCDFRHKNPFGSWLPPGVPISNER